MDDVTIQDPEMVHHHSSQHVNIIFTINFSCRTKLLKQSYRVAKHLSFDDIATRHYYNKIYDKKLAIFMPSATKRKRKNLPDDGYVDSRKRNSRNNNNDNSKTNHDSIGTDQNESSIKTVKIQVAKVTSTTTTTSSNPVVVSLPGGVPESTNQLKFVWQKMNETSKSGRQIIGFDQNCLYTASAKGVGYDDRQTKLVVGVYNKKRSTVTLYEAAARGTVFALRQSVPSYTKQNHLLVDTGKGADVASRPNVFEDFGSSKKRRVLKSQAANRVDIDNVVGAGDGSAMVRQMMKGQGMSESNRMAIEEDRRANSTQKTASEKALEAGRMQILPAFDQHAVKPEKVYDAKNIAGDKAWKRVFDKVYACLHKENPTNTIIESIYERDWQDFVLKFVKEIDPQSDSAGFCTTCAIFVNWMVKFYRFNSKMRQIEGVNEAKATYYGMPSEVAARCFDLFSIPVPKNGPAKSSKGFFVMTKVCKDKMIVHILLMFMMAQGPSMKIPRINPIAASLNIPAGQCAGLLKYAGCKVVKIGNDTSASLKTPLEFPTMGRRGPPRR
jgi:hypothetical protein